jgi:O-antigen/teichoic acid export membrane protein
LGKARKPGLNLKLMISWTIAMTVLVALLTPRWGALGFAIGFCIPVVLGNALVLVILKRIVPDARLWPRTRALILGCLAVAALGRFVLAPLCNGPLSFGLGVLGSTASFLGVVALLDRHAIVEIRSLLRKNRTS